MNPEKLDAKQVIGLAIRESGLARDINDLHTPPEELYRRLCRTLERVGFTVQPRDPAVFQMDNTPEQKEKNAKAAAGTAAANQAESEDRPQG